MKGQFFHSLCTGILPPQIKIGGFSQLKLEDRLCKICNTNAVEDAFHFIIYCNVYKEIRQTFFNNTDINRQETDENMLKYLFDMYPRKLAKFIIKLNGKKKET